MAINQSNNDKSDPLLSGLLANDTMVNGYRITGLIRAGQSNNVYAAVSHETKKAVALKEYFPRKLGRRLPSGRIGQSDDRKKQQFESGVKGFINEAIALTAIKSELLANYIAAFRENGTAYLVTEFEEGDTMERWARSMFATPGHYPPEADLRIIFWMLLHAVQVMHNKGYLHLDIKPSNVIMRDVHTPILIDLGGARRFPLIGDREISVSNYTPGFAAPEQYAEKVKLFAPCTDIYGIGSSILYCMTGKVPPLATARMQNDTIHEFMVKCQGRYSSDLITIVQNCMILDIARRYDNVKSLQNLISQL